MTRPSVAPLPLEELRDTYRTGLQPEEFFRVALPAPGSE